MKPAKSRSVDVELGQVVAENSAVSFVAVD